MSSLNSTHTIQIKQENRGVRFLVGLVSAVVLIRWWITGSLLGRCDVCRQSRASKRNGVRFWCLDSDHLRYCDRLRWNRDRRWLGAWYVIWDLIQGSIEAIRIWRGKKAAIATATETALQAAGVAAGAVAGVESAKAVANAVQEPRPISAVKLERALRILPIASSKRKPESMS